MAANMFVKKKKKKGMKWRMNAYMKRDRQKKKSSYIYSYRYSRTSKFTYIVRTFGWRQVKWFSYGNIKTYVILAKKNQKSVRITSLWLIFTVYTGPNIRSRRVTVQCGEALKCFRQNSFDRRQRNPVPSVFAAKLNNGSAFIGIYVQLAHNILTSRTHISPLTLEI